MRCTRNLLALLLQVDPRVEAALAAYTDAICEYNAASCESSLRDRQDSQWAEDLARAWPLAPRACCIVQQQHHQRTTRLLALMCWRVGHGGNTLSLAPCRCRPSA